jgi:hypothetical protein
MNPSSTKYCGSSPKSTNILKNEPEINKTTENSKHTHQQISIIAPHINNDKIEKLEEKIDQLEEKIMRLTTIQQPPIAHQPTVQQPIANQSIAQHQHISQEPSTININQTLNQTINVHFNQKMVDIFEKTKQLHGVDVAVKRSVDLVSNKNKHNKHDWVKNPELMNQEDWSRLVKYRGRNPSGAHQFELRLSQDQTVMDDGRKLDSVLTDIVANSVIKSQNYIHQLMCDQSTEEPNWSLLDQTGLYQSKNVNIHTMYQRFKDIKPESNYYVGLINS